jgi:precorrin-3B C17-methyltransferase
MKRAPESPPGPLFVIGLGPGDSSLLAPEALAALHAASVIVGYSGYISLLSAESLDGRRIIATGMTGEIARVRAAIDSAFAGEATVLVCSGDPGIYAMAGLVLELMEEQGISAADFPLHIVPGIPAVCAAAALLGAPLMHDFACVSLSDLLTPGELILKRVECALAGDFVVALYNPRSKRRVDLLEETLAAALRHRNPDTPVGVVRNAFRPGQDVRILPLTRVDPAQADMTTLLIMGNRSSRIVPGRGENPLAWECGARMLTPRGYREKYLWKKDGASG